MHSEEVFLMFVLHSYLQSGFDGGADPYHMGSEYQAALLFKDYWLVRVVACSTNVITLCHEIILLPAKPNVRGGQWSLLLSPDLRRIRVEAIGMEKVIKPGWGFVNMLYYPIAGVERLRLPFLRQRTTQVYNSRV